MKKNNLLLIITSFLIVIYFSVLSIFMIDTFINEDSIIDNSLTVEPTVRPTEQPTLEPTIEPSELHPTVEPTIVPSVTEPTVVPSELEPTPDPTDEPIVDTFNPTINNVTMKVFKSISTYSNIFYIANNIIDLEFYNFNLAEYYFGNTEVNSRILDFDKYSYLFLSYKKQLNINSLTYINEKTIFNFVSTFDVSVKDDNYLHFISIPKDYYYDSNEFMFFIDNELVSFDDVMSTNCSFINNYIYKNYCYFKLYADDEKANLNMEHLYYKNTKDSVFHALLFSFTNYNNSEEIVIFYHDHFIKLEDAYYSLIINDKDIENIKNLAQVYKNKYDIAAAFKFNMGITFNGFNKVYGIYNDAMVFTINSEKSDYSNSTYIGDQFFYFEGNSNIYVYSNDYLYTLQDYYSALSSSFSNGELSEIAKKHKEENYEYLSDIHDFDEIFTLNSLNQMQLVTEHFDSDEMINDTIFTNNKSDCITTYLYLYTLKIYHNEFVIGDDELYPGKEMKYLNLLNHNNKLSINLSNKTIYKGFDLYSVDYSLLPKFTQPINCYTFNFSSASIFVKNTIDNHGVLVDCGDINNLDYISFIKYDGNDYSLLENYYIENENFGKIIILDNLHIKINDTFYKVIGTNDFSDVIDSIKVKYEERYGEIDSHVVTIKDYHNVIEDKTITVNNEYKLTSEEIFNLFDEFNSSKGDFYIDELLNEKIKFESSIIDSNLTLYYKYNDDIDFYNLKIDTFDKDGLGDVNNTYTIIKNLNQLEEFNFINSYYYGIGIDELAKYDEEFFEEYILIIISSNLDVSLVDVSGNKYVLYGKESTKDHVHTLVVSKSFAINYNRLLFKYNDTYGSLIEASPEFIDLPTNIIKIRFANQYHVNSSEYQLYAVNYNSNMLCMSYIFLATNVIEADINSFTKTIKLDIVDIDVKKAKMLYVYYNYKIYTLEEAYENGYINKNYLSLFLESYDNDYKLKVRFFSDLAKYENKVVDVTIINKLDKVDGIDVLYNAKYYNQVYDVNSISRLVLDSYCYDIDEYSKDMQFLLYEYNFNCDNKFFKVTNYETYEFDGKTYMINLDYIGLPNGVDALAFDSSVLIYQNDIQMLHIPQGKIILKEYKDNYIDLSNDHILKVGDYEFAIIDKDHITIKGRFFELIGSRKLYSLDFSNNEYNVNVYDIDNNLLKSFVYNENQELIIENVIYYLPDLGDNYDLYMNINYESIPLNYKITKNIDLYYFKDDYKPV